MTEGSFPKNQFECSIVFADGYTEGEFIVEDLGNGQFRLETPPLFPGMDEEEPESFPNYKDVIKAERIDEKTLRFIEIARESGYVTFSYMIGHELTWGKEFQQFADKIVKMGGYLETVFVGWLRIFMPPGIPYDPNDDLDSISK